MKNRNIFIHSLIGLLAVSCTVQEPDIQVSPIIEEPVEEDVFYASLESDSTPETKVYVDGSATNLKMHWDAEDQLSIFNKNTLNHQYQFAGETGDIAGYFTSVSDPAGTGNDLDFIYAVYPYQESMTISDEGVLNLTIPAEQAYLDGTFDPGANVMVSTTDGNILKFKNVGGYLVLKFYGSGVSVKSIRLDGHNGEKLSGEATVISSINGNPEITMTSTEGSSITITPNEPIELGGSDNPTVFWMVVPPTHFTSGFRLTVTDTEGNVFIKDTSKDLTISRNGVLRIAPIQVVMNSAELSLDDVSVIGKKFKVTDKTNRTFTVTMPTVTDFTNLVFDFDFSGESIIADGKDIIPGETAIDASHDVTITVRSGNQGKNYTLKAQNTGLPVVRITTEGFTRQDIEDDTDHEYWRGTSKERPGENAWIHVETPGGDTDVNIQTEIKGRGNASWTYDKRPYALKLNKKRSVLGMTESKRWILLANWKDRTLLRNDATFWLSKKSGLPYTVDGHFVELEFNGEYRGNYYLCEQIKIESGRVDINEFNASDVTGGYLMEIDNNYDETYRFLSGFYRSSGYNAEDKGLKYMFKDPDEDLPDEAFNYMKNYIQEMEALIKKIPNGNYGYREYIDMDSAIWFMFINELTGNGDFFNTDGNMNSRYYGPHSTYLYKDRDLEDGTRSKLFMGPVWDFDYLTFYDKSGTPSRSNKWVGVAESNYYFYYFTRDSAFRSRAYQLWSAYKPTIESALLTYIDDMKNYLALSEMFNTEMWGWSGTDQGQNGDNGDSFDTAVSKMKSAFTTKLTFMNGRITENATYSNYRN